MGTEPFLFRVDKFVINVESRRNNSGGTFNCPAHWVWRMLGQGDAGVDKLEFYE
jgi:hypothetical protein